MTSRKENKNYFLKDKISAKLFPYSTQLCPTQMAYWAKIYVNISTRAAHWRIY